MSGRKRKLANLLDPAFLRALMAPPNNDGTAPPPPLLQLTNGAVQALCDSQEAFVQQLAQQLHADRLTEEKVRHVQPHHVETAMRAMGLDDVVEEALQHLQQQQQEEEESATADLMKNAPRAKKRKAASTKGKKGAKFTAEMEAEQERLLQASLQKLGNGA